MQIWRTFNFHVSMLHFFAKKHNTRVILVIFHVIPHNMHYIKNFVQV